ncbi:hypothetical protein M0657_011491 [Pyricularia oryzae]|nr:hypothetical protein M0657_011491 [Pyricularia oryzae]
MSIVLTKFDRRQVTDPVLKGATRLYSSNYGKWDKKSGFEGQVKLSERRLKEDFLPENADAVYHNVTVDGILAGHVFACRWKVNDKQVCWVTQLVVNRDHRNRGLASTLLRSLRTDKDDLYGIMSSHPAAITAAAKAFGFNLSLIKEDGNAIMKASPVVYIKKAVLCGSLVNADDQSGLVLGVNTSFYVDHTEPLEALKIVKEDGDWPFGELPDGHEYLLILESRGLRSRSRSSSHDRGGALGGL